MNEIVFRTPRLLLRKLVPDDAERMFELNAEPEVMRYLPKSTHPGRRRRRRRVARLVRATQD